ncbi:uncharacterized protein LOC111370237 [Olea europaea var. sylvestris]|uniref:uncharacterized protein LOC111370237 n=1 Tax=Olea europaea var. sylvestris TaxID=158386 RepID=UPI000C1CF6C6|nr:uncharacterized protein LOC111370237 [Olea europaea var. sylvestris]
MSFGYTLNIGPILAFAKVVGTFHFNITLLSIDAPNYRITASKGQEFLKGHMMETFILLNQGDGEIKEGISGDTLKISPPENRMTKKVSITALVITTALFICCGCFGYVAFGNGSPGNLLMGFYVGHTTTQIFKKILTGHIDDMIKF